MPRISVEAANGVWIHCSPAQLQNVLKDIGGSRKYSKCDDEQNILAIAADAANRALDMLIVPCGLQGAAVHNLGTALRAKTVRDKLQAAVTSQQLDLLLELSYVAKAADAHRHLTATTIEQAIHALDTCVHMGKGCSFNGGSSKYSNTRDETISSISDDTYIELEPDLIAAWWGDGAELGDNSSETKFDIAQDTNCADLDGSKY